MDARLLISTIAGGGMVNDIENSPKNVANPDDALKLPDAGR